MSDTKVSALTSAAALTGAERLPVTQSGLSRAATVTQVLNLADVISVRGFGAVGDGTTNDSAAILTACNAGVSAGLPVYFGAGNFKMGSTLALTSSHNNLAWILDKATISKGFNGDLVTLTSCDNFSIDGVGIIDGVMTSFTGKGFVLPSGSQRFYIGPGILTKAFAGTHVEFGADAGYFSRLECDMVGDASQATPTMITCTGLDTSARQRTFSGTVIGTISLTGAQATFVKCPLVNQVTISSTCNVTIVAGTTWSNNGNAITIDGANTIITGCRMAGDVTINVGTTGAYVGNRQTTATFVNNSITMTVIGEFVVNVPDGTAALPGMSFRNDPDTGFWRRGANVITASVNGSDQVELSSGTIALISNEIIKWGNAATISGIGVFDTGLTRKAAGVVEVNNGTLGTVQSIKGYPVTDADALQTACLVRAGTGAPNNANGANGDVYFRSDGGAGTTLYQRRAGVWVATAA